MSWSAFAQQNLMTFDQEHLWVSTLSRNTPQIQLSKIHKVSIYCISCFSKMHMICVSFVDISNAESYGHEATRNALKNEKVNGVWLVNYYNSPIILLGNFHLQFNFQMRNCNFTFGLNRLPNTSMYNSWGVMVASGNTVCWIVHVQASISHVEM